jgi:hypothetical protein
MGVALESARNFAETQRLLKETAQRNAELAVINSIQQGVSAQLDFQRIIDLVGDKLREVFSTGEISIKWWDRATNTLHTPYGFEHGIRYELPPSPVRPGGLPEKILRDRVIGLLNTVAEAEAAGIQIVAGTDTPLCSIRVPIIAGDHALGYIMLENYEREYAFGEAEIRLLTTVANGMGVALENARLFDETQRLLKETEQRNAELAIINSVQEGLASKLEIDAIYTLVGTRSARSSPPTPRTSPTTTSPTTRSHFPTTSIAEPHPRSSPRPRAAFPTGAAVVGHHRVGQASTASHAGGAVRPWRHQGRIPRHDGGHEQHVPRRAHFPQREAIRRRQRAKLQGARLRAKTT